MTTRAPSTTPATLQRALLRSAESAAGQLAVAHRSGRLERRDYAEVAVAARRVAAGLRGLGIAPGERVALVLPTSFEFVEAFLGTLLAGAIPTPLYPPVRLGKLDEYHEATARMIRAASARLVLTDRLVWGLLGHAVERARPALGCRTVASIAAADPLAEADLTLGAPGDVALVQFSSGTTVDPKPVALSQANILANLGAISSSFPGGVAAQSGVSWLPLYHDMGLIGFLMSAIVGGRPLTLIRPEDFVARPALWLRLLTETGATISAAPNFAYGLCVDRVKDRDLEGLDLSRWSLALCGAEPVNPATLDRFAERFEPVGFDRRALTPVYGLSEAALAVAFSDPRRAPRSIEVDAEALARDRTVTPKPGGRAIVSVGRPVAGVDLELRDDAGDPVGEDRVGRIHARGPSIMTGYLDRPEATAAAISPDGWLDTGDLGFLHEGELHICGRAKDVIILNGRNYDPQTIEQSLDGVEGIRTGCHAAFSIEDETGDADGEVLCVLAEMQRNGVDRDPEQLARRAGERVIERTGLVPASVLILEPGTLPRTSSGKIRRGRARDLLLTGELRAPGQAGLIALLRAQWDGFWAHRNRKLAGR